ncbi:MAG TPA: OsmC family protein [Gemmatimonadales bacterium]
MTLALYARTKRWPLEEVRVHLRHTRVHAKDCAECESRYVRMDVIDRDITLVGSLTEGQRDRLRALAERCPVHQTLASEVRIDTTVH